MRRVRKFFAAALIAMPGIVHAAEIVPDACRLLTTSEIHEAAGGSVTGFGSASTLRGGTSSLCQGRAGGAMTTIRVSEQAGQDAQNEQIIRRMITANGGKVATVQTGAVACTTIVPAPAMAVEYGYDSM